MLALPLYRLVVPQWPAPIVELVSPDGRVQLREPERTGGIEAIARSRPLNAARIQRADGRSGLGYVVSVRADGLPSRSPPGSAVWRPAGDCEVAVQRPGQPPEWIRCAGIVEVSRPNRMRPIERLRLAVERAMARAAL